jgi:hypothetical protein
MKSRFKYLPVITTVLFFAEAARDALPVDYPALFSGMSVLIKDEPGPVEMVRVRK